VANSVFRILGAGNKSAKPRLIHVISELVRIREMCYDKPAAALHKLSPRLRDNIVCDKVRIHNAHTVSQEEHLNPVIPPIDRGIKVVERYVLARKIMQSTLFNNELIKD